MKKDNGEETYEKTARLLYEACAFEMEGGICQAYRLVDFSPTPEKILYDICNDEKMSIKTRGLFRLQGVDFVFDIPITSLPTSAKASYFLLRPKTWKERLTSNDTLSVIKNGPFGHC